MKIEKISLTKTMEYPRYIPLTLFFLLLTLAEIASATPSAAAGDVSAGFLYDRFPLTLEAGNRTEAAGVQALESGMLVAEGWG